MAFGSESEESEGVSNIIFSKIPETNRSEGDRTRKFVFINLFNKINFVCLNKIWHFAFSY